MRRFGKMSGVVTRVWRFVRVLPLVLVTASTPILASCGDSTAPNGCCKVCKTGKACGDTCIAKTDTCHKGAGCACDG
jgi:hypothetical protein